MDTIFIKIASYRDQELPKTINSALLAAKHPQRLRFGICWQYDERTMLDLDPYVSDDRFRVYQTYYKNSKGCCWARHQTDLLYQGETYMLQIDAHMRFAQGWDQRFIEMLENLPADKPVLSTYPAPFLYDNHQEKRLHDRGVQRLVCSRLHKNLTTTFTTKQVDDHSTPQPSQFIAAGQLFAHGHFCEVIQYDPDLYYVGEEISISARAYTHGYDFFCPNEDLLWHLYQHQMPTHSKDHEQTQNESAIKRLAVLLTGSHETLGKYGLGEVRSLEEYEGFSGLDFKTARNCIRVETNFKRTLLLDLSNIPDSEDYDFWIFSLRDSNGDALCRKDIYDQNILSGRETKMEIDEFLDDIPVSYGIWPHSESKGFLEKQIIQLPTE